MKSFDSLPALSAATAPDSFYSWLTDGRSKSYTPASCRPLSWARVSATKAITAELWTWRLGWVGAMHHAAIAAVGHTQGSTGSRWPGEGTGYSAVGAPAGAGVGPEGHRSLPASASLWFCSLCCRLAKLNCQNKQHCLFLWKTIHFTNPFHNMFCSPQLNVLFSEERLVKEPSELLC